MRLIDADRLVKSMRDDEEFGRSTITIEDIEKFIYDEPDVFLVFTGGARVGKKALAEYVAMCKVLDDHGIDSTDPIKNLDFVLRQYQRVIVELTGSTLSKLTYYADEVIARINDELDERDRDLSERERAVRNKERELGFEKDGNKDVT